VAQDFVRVSPTDGQETILSLRKINWKDFSSFPAEPVDVLLGSDLVYDANILAILVPAVAKLLKPDGQFLYVAPDTGRDGMTDLIESLLAIDMVCVESFPVPEE
jgi:predicted nicotinamide N-methyase